MILRWKTAFPEKIKCPNIKHKFSFPEEIYLYEKNAFQILGLLPYKANLRAIKKRKDELLGLVRLNLEPKEHIKKDYYVITWPGSGETDESNIIDAQERLEDKMKGIKEDLFWFHLKGGKIGAAFEFTLKGNFEEGQRLWEKDKKNNGQNYTGALAIHNLAILQHAITLSQERNIAIDPETEMGKNQITNWEKSFSLWKKVSSSKKCWDYFNERIVFLDDPCINKKHISNLRKKLPELVLKINLEIAKVALSQGISKYAEQHLNLIRKSGFSSKSIYVVMEELFYKHIKELNGIIKTLEASPHEEHKGIVEKVVEIIKAVKKLDGEKYIRKEVDLLGPLLESKICSFCNVRTAIPKYVSKVKMHRITERIPMGSYYDVGYETISVNVPRCSKDKYCQPSSNNSVVNKYLSEGWCFGKEPPEELD